MGTNLAKKGTYCPPGTESSNSSRRSVASFALIFTSFEGDSQSAFGLHDQPEVEKVARTCGRILEGNSIILHYPLHLAGAGSAMAAAWVIFEDSSLSKRHLTIGIGAKGSELADMCSGAVNVVWAYAGNVLGVKLSL